MARRTDNVPEPPNASAAEEYVLGAMMLSPNALESVPEVLSVADFYRDSHRRIYEACLTLHASGSAVDAVTVAHYLEANGLLAAAGGLDRIREIATLVPAATNAPHHARVIREASIRRALINTGVAIAQAGWEPPDGETANALSEAERLVFDLTNAEGRVREDLTPAREVVRDTYRMMEELAASGRRMTGVPTGYGILDGMIYGFKPGNLVIVAGRPSMGKTALALGMIANVVLRQEEPVPVALFTLEMNKTEVMQRVISSEALVDSTRVQNPWKLDQEEWRRVARAASRLEQAPLWIDQTGATTMTDIRSKARRWKLRHPEGGLIVVDYVQLMAAGVRADNRNAELSLISRSMKLLAVEMGVPVVILSQLSREVESRHDKRPILSDLRDSGALEQDADIVLTVYREEYYYPEDMEQQGIAEVNVLKHRNGPTGIRKLAFKSEYARFSDLHVPVPE